MKDERLEAALNEEVDGFTPPAQEARLREILAADPEARSYLDDLSHLSRVIEATGTATPPPELKANILRAVRALPIPGASPAPRAIRLRRPWFERALGFLQGSGVGRAGLVFGSGVAVGLVVFALAGKHVRPEADALSGAMAPHVEKASPGAARTFDLNGTRGTVETRYAAGEIWLVVALDAGAPARFEIELEGATRPLGIERSLGAPGSVTLEPSRISIQADAPGQTIIRLSPSGAPAEAVVRVVASGESMEERLPLDPAGR